MQRKDNNHKIWAGEKKPSMKRRCETNNYTERGIYLITIATEGRKTLLGTLVGKADVTEGSDKPHVVLSPLKECWLSIQQYHPQIESMKLCIMPDHIHGILFVHEKIEKHLGHIIWGFKTGTRKAARELGLLPTAQLAQPTELNSVQYTALTAQSNPSRHTAAGRAHGTLWESGYNDRILLKKDQLQHWIAYLEDNPRRLLLKRQHPEYFTLLSPIPVLDTTMPAMGNRFLLDHPQKLQVQCSRHLYPWEIEEQKQHFLQAGQQGAIIVSPCIRKACAEGRLLLMSPFQWQNEKITNMRQRCLFLNELAKRICQT